MPKGWFVSDVAADSRSGPGALHAYIATLRQHRWLIAAMVAVVTGSVLLSSYLQTPSYRSEARVLVRAVNAAFGFAGGGLFNIQTESQLVASEPVAEFAGELLGFEGPPASLLEGLGVAVATETEILVVSYDSEDPQVAQERAQAFAEGYLTFRREQVETEAEATNERLTTQISSINRQISGLTARSDSAGGQQRASIQTQINVLVSQLALLEQQRSRLVTPSEIEFGQVVQPAVLPSRPFSPNYLQNTILGLLLGGLVGIGAAFLRERLDDRLRGRQDLERHLGYPVLGVIPSILSWRRAGESKLVTVEEPHSAASEANKTLRAGTLFVASKSDARLLMVTGPQAGEGKTSTLANLGVAIANADRRVILVSADLRRPRLHEFFGLDNFVGVTTVLAGETEVHDAVRRVGVDRLRVLASGPPPRNPAEVLGSEAMGELLGLLREMADIVLVDTPPVLSVADAIIMAPATDGIIFVADANRATRTSVLHSAQQLEQVNGVVLGAVLNNFNPGKSVPYGYYESHIAPLNAEGGFSRSDGNVFRRLRKAARS